MCLPVTLVQHVIRTDCEFARTGENLVRIGCTRRECGIGNERLKRRSRRVEALDGAVEKRAVRTCGEFIPLRFRCRRVK